MASTARRDRAAWDVARLHFEGGHSMEEIADRLGVSRSTVSRLLQHARDIGLVEVRVASSPDEIAPLERRLSERWGIKVVVAAVPPGSGDEATLEHVAEMAARVIADAVTPESVIGVAWGSTMEAVSRHLPARATPGSTVVQLNGAGNFHTSGVPYASELLRRFGEAFGARIEQFPVPTFFDAAATRDAFWRERTTRRILALHARLDLAVFGIGSPFANTPGHVYQGGYLERSDYSQLRAERVVGDVATVFYRADGSFTGIPLNDRASGPSFAVLRRARRRVCVVSGAGKSPALGGALAAGLITDLIVDRDLALATLRSGR
ncbi:sugar-binding transcriptional regulator [Microbacterium rhizomatis]|uniref:sugar-binding transcriptional regulator n=1 Tax=Microbacterium rhizomatis TaxID=1631477 RepID=UPI001FE3177F|nr:sugar-binding domain-containing protein [Microbacterium rhizomatis]